MSLEALRDSYVLAPELLAEPDGFAAGRGVAVGADGRICWVGEVGRLPDRYAGWPVHRLERCAVTPGLVDAHQHVSQSLGAPFAYGEPSEIFARVWVPLERELSESELAVSARLAAFESLRGGFTAMADAGTRSDNDVELIAEQTRQAGIRTVLSLICHDTGPGAPDRALVLRRAEAHLHRYADDPWVRPSLAVATSEMATPETLRALARLCREAGAVLQIHVNEHQASVERSLLTVGRRPLEHLDDLGVVGPWLLAAHATLLTPTELLMLRDRGAAWSYNPVASAWKGNAIADALTLTSLGVRTGLGTDGTRGDGFRLMDAAETAQRFRSAMSVADPFAGSGRTWWQAATAGGADAIGCGGTVGEIAVGRWADLLVIDLDTPELTPLIDPEWALVRTGSRDLVRAVITAGRTRLVSGRPVDWDASALLAEAIEAAEKVACRAGLTMRRPRVGTGG